MQAEVKNYKEDWQAAQKILRRSSENHAFVYVHIRADNDEPMYVGIGRSYKRPWYTGLHRSLHHRNSIKKHGLRVEIIADNLSWDSAKWCEVKLIKDLRDAGCNILNLTDGGEGVPGLVHNEKTKALFVELKRKIDRETLFKIYSDNRSDTYVAIDYGMSRRVISQIKSGRRYKEDLSLWISTQSQWASLEDFLQWRRKEKHRDICVSSGKKRRKMSKENILNILEDNRTYFEIASDYNIAFQTVGKIKLGYRYKEWFDEWCMKGKKQCP